MKYQKGDLVIWNPNTNYHILRAETIMLITGIVEELYEYPYGQGYAFIYIETGRKDQCSKKHFEQLTQKIG